MFVSVVRKVVISTACACTAMVPRDLAVTVKTFGAASSKVPLAGMATVTVIGTALPAGTTVRVGTICTAHALVVAVSVAVVESMPVLVIVR